MFEAFNALTCGGDVPLTFHVYKLSFLNFLIGKQPNGPGQFLFGTVEVKVSFLFGTVEVKVSFLFGTVEVKVS